MSRTGVRVLFDSEVFANQVHGGISRYYSELIPRLGRYGVRPTLILPATVNSYIRPGLGVWLGARVSLPKSRWIRRLISGGALLADHISARLSDWDVIHHTYYNRSALGPGRASCTVVDMTPELMPSEFVGGNPHGRKLEMARRAEIVLAISEVTRRDLVQLVPDLKGRVYVTPLAVDSQFFERFASGESNRKRPYVLFVGDRCGYKNFRTFADAMVAVMREQDDISLVCVGGGPLNEAERAVFRREGLEKRLEWLTASDRELAALYGHAECFVFPSQYEGFGLPILEAMASGCPVVLSSTSCFPEVAEDAGEYFDPSSSESIVAAIRTVLGSKSRKRELRELGRSRLRAFSWEKTAELSARAFSQT